MTSIFGVTYDLQLAVSETNDIFVPQYVNAACLTLCVFEYLCVFDREVQLVWIAPWNFGKVLHLVVRHLPIIFFILLLYMSGSDCYLYLAIRQVGGNICLCVAEVVFTLRTWAIWGRTRLMSFILAVCFLVTWSSNFVGSILVAWLPVNQLKRPLCSGNGSQPLPLTILVTLIVYYSVLFSLTLTKTILNVTTPSGNGSRLIYILHIDGLIYYVYLLALSAAAIATAFTNDSLLWLHILFMLQVVLTSIFTCRMMLRLREYAEMCPSVHGTTSTVCSESLGPLVFSQSDLGFLKNDISIAANLQALC